jgi:hypothetical protein
MRTRYCPSRPLADEPAAVRRPLRRYAGRAPDAPHPLRKTPAFLYPRILGAFLAATLPGVPAAHGAERPAAVLGRSADATLAPEHARCLVIEDGARGALHANAG